MIWAPVGIEASLSNLVVCQVLLMYFLSMVRRSLGLVGGLDGEWWVYRLPAKETLMQGERE